MSHYEREREAYEDKMQQKHGLSPYIEQESYTRAPEQVVVYAVLAYDKYYPDDDNVKGMFDNYDKAERFLSGFMAEKDYYDTYKIVDYVLNQPT